MTDLSNLIITKKMRIEKVIINKKGSTMQRPFYDTNYCVYSVYPTVAKYRLRN